MSGGHNLSQLKCTANVFLGNHDEDLDEDILLQAEDYPAPSPTAPSSSFFTDVLSTSSTLPKPNHAFATEHNYALSTLQLRHICTALTPASEQMTSSKPTS